jgi:hypothetical protein
MDRSKLGRFVSLESNFAAQHHMLYQAKTNGAKSLADRGWGQCGVRHLQRAKPETDYARH